MIDDPDATKFEDYSCLATLRLETHNKTLPKWMKCQEYYGFGHKTADVESQLPALLTKITHAETGYPSSIRFLHTFNAEVNVVGHLANYCSFKDVSHMAIFVENIGLFYLLPAYIVVKLTLTTSCRCLPSSASLFFTTTDSDMSRAWFA